MFSLTGKPILQNFIFEWSLPRTPDRQEVMLRIVKKIRFARRRRYETIVMSDFGFLRCLWDQPCAGLQCANWIRPALGFFARMTEEMKSSSRLTIADSALSAKAELSLVRFCRKRVVGMTFWPMTMTTIDTGANENKNLSKDFIRRCFPRSLRSLHFSDLSRGPCS